MKANHLVFLASVLAIGLALSLSQSDAYERYKNDAGQSGSNCSACHSDFTDGSSPTGATFPGDDKHQMHRSSGSMNTECNLCHTSGDDRNPFIGSSTGTAANTGYGCVGCHGRVEDAGNDSLSAGLGAGLRQHHTNAGITMCSACHFDASPANYTPVGENVKPPYYDTVDTLVMKPCNPDNMANVNENWTIGDFLGLDNDGDFLYDTVDGDCQMAVDCPDQDNDGYAVCDAGCEPPLGAQCGDCDDTDASVNPGATEGPDGDPSCSDALDNDCDGLTDAGDSDCDPVVIFCADDDVDGYVVCDGQCTVPTNAQCGDCDDNDSTVNPGATEGPNGDPTCEDMADNDCDGSTDAADPDCDPVLCVDADTDGWAACDGNCELPMGAQCGDCDDTDAAVNPGATEGPNGDPTCEDMADNDCDGSVDLTDSGCDPVLVPCPDEDADGWAVCDATCQAPMGTQCGDCDDTDPFVNPGATEGPFMDPTCVDEFDNDCNGFVDGNDAACIAPDLSDYDIDRFRCSRSVKAGKRISLRVNIENEGDTDPGALLTVYGTREDGTTIPIVMDLDVFGRVGHEPIRPGRRMPGRSGPRWQSSGIGFPHGKSNFTYTATAEDIGIVTWTAELSDGTPGAQDAAEDTATCTTRVRRDPFGPGGEDDDDDEEEEDDDDDDEEDEDHEDDDARSRGR